MHFGDIQKWSPSEVKYERGASLRIYGVPINAWNDAFFRMYVSSFGRFLHANECTVDKARLEFARILISTTILEIVNSSVDFFIDGCKYVIKVVEEWGCHLGEDAFMTEAVEEPRLESVQQHNNTDLDEVQGEW